MRIETALQQYSRRLARASDTATLDVQVLVGHILGHPRAWVLAHPEWTFEPEAEQALEVAITRLEGGEPLPYILGHWEFFGLDFQVSPSVLIPRPETELLVETALSWLRRRTLCRTAVQYWLRMLGPDQAVSLSLWPYTLPACASSLLTYLFRF